VAQHPPIDTIAEIRYTKRPRSDSMASNTRKSETKRKRRDKNMGRKRKNALATKSTASYAELFARMGEPGQPAAN
jgi:hypothetical protein